MNPAHRLVRILSLFLLGCFISITQPSRAEEFPSHAIRMLVPFSVGGAADIVARLLAKEMSTTLGQPVVVENRPGASGNIALDAAARSAPDGYTIVLGSASMAINPTLIKATPYDSQKDFTPISLVAMVPSVVVVPKSLPVDSLADLIALAKAKPDSINYGSVGIGTTQHLAAATLALRAGIKLTHVPYKGADALMPDLIAGRIQMSFNNVASARTHLQSGALKALAIGLPKRWTGLPDVPTFSEAGLPDLEVSSWVALFGPAGLPAKVVASLERAAIAAMVSEPTREKVLSGGNEPVGGTSAELAKFLAAEIDHWNKAIETAGAKPQ